MIIVLRVIDMREAAERIRDILMSRHYLGKRIIIHHLNQKVLQEKESIL
jgi:hypothetical protein